MSQMNVTDKDISKIKEETLAFRKQFIQSETIVKEVDNQIKEEEKAIASLGFNADTLDSDIVNIEEKINELYQEIMDMYPSEMG